MHVKALLSILCVVLLGACAPAQPQTGAGAAGEPVELTFLIAGDPTDEVAYTALINAFTASHPEISLDLINVPSNSDFRKRLTADFAAGTPPDIFLVNYRRYGPYLAKNAIEPLTKYLAESTLIDEGNYYPQALEAFVWEGELMCMPQNMSSPVVYYNKDLFDAAGVAYPEDAWSWDEFVATAAALTGDIDGDGTVDVYGVGLEPSIVRAAPFVWMNGGELVDDPDAPTALTMDAPATAEALAWFTELQTVHRVTPGAVAEVAESSESRFLNGRLGMIVESRRAVPEFRAIQGFDWDVAPLPVGKERASVLHSDAYCISAAGHHKDAAWIFIEFANTLEGQTLLAETGRTVPSLIELAESPVFLDPDAKPANSQVFLDAIPTIRNLPIMATWFDIEGVVNTELENVFYGREGLDDAMETASKRSREFFE